MHYMHDLKDLLCAELEDYAEKGKKSGKMSMGDLETVHKLTDTVKNILKIDTLSDELGYSEDGHYMGEGRTMALPTMTVCTVRVAIPMPVVAVMPSVTVWVAIPVTMV